MVQDALVKYKSRVIFGVLTLASFAASAEVTFNDSRVWRRARMITGGQQVWSFQTSYQKITEQFAANGKVEPLGAPYARAVTWGQLLKAETSAQGRSDMESYMRSRGAQANDVAATSTYSLEREDLKLSMDWAYGLTRNWMIGFQVPLIVRNTRVSSRINMTPQLAEGAGQSSQQSMLGLNRNEMRQKVKAMAEQELANSGYDNVPDQSREWQWGDVSLLSQFSLMQSRQWQWSLQQMVRFPTAQNPSVSDYLEQASDEGQVDLGLTSLLDYRIRRWTLGSRVGYVAQLPDSARMRTGREGAASVDPKVHRDLGDWVWAALDADYRLNRRWGFDLEYAFLHKQRDKFSGDIVLARETDQEVHQTRVGVIYDIGQASARRGVEKKWVATLGYTQPWIGRNSADAGKAAVEIISYF